MSVTITVPEEITAGFVVATDQVPGDVTVAIRQRLSGRYATEIAERLNTPRLALSGYRAADSPWDLSQVIGVDVEDIERVRHAARHIGVTCTLPVSDLPVGLHIARTAAKAIAESLCGVPVDLACDQVLTVIPFGRIGEFVLADEWLGASLPPYRNAGQCTADEDDIDGCACVDLTTRGLHRFGLPELEITDAACPHDLAALNILRTAAQRLLPLGRHAGEHVLPSEVLLTSEDFAAFWGGHEPVWDDGPVPARLVEVAPDQLGIRPPADFPGSLNEWLWDEIPPVLHELLSCEPDASLHPS
ncbi:hypothetical protein [Actinomadura rubrisoli]|uniref:Uncharacterized protein n=1 Tax=Actinomadura rubrisoli TaxID=2530368 RepID=A0A4R5BKV9_9ACTN|nr:hypothetical protein [Actinomadura rubrisoli]TDD85866.1 hypothetical protein E1298_18220 [Actinomadura rubrisoli]